MSAAGPACGLGLPGRRYGDGNSNSSCAIKPGDGRQRRARPTRPGRRQDRGVSPYQRTGLAKGDQGVVRRPQLRHARRGASIERRRLQGGRTATLRGGGARQLEGEACRGERSSCGDGDGPPGRRVVARGADPAGDGQLPRSGDRPRCRLSGDPPAGEGAVEIGAARAACIGQHRRGHPRGRVPHLRRGRLAGDEVRKVSLRTLLLAALAGGSAIAVFRLSLRYRRDLKAARSRLAEVDRRVVLTDWGAVEYAERGSGEPLLVLHGIFHGCDGGLLTVRDLCPDRRVIAPSRFGYLGSSLPAHATPADQADALAALLDT